ncbi:MAG: M48 family metalloprotease, partial [Hyphomicrobiaceae bacterium]
MSMLSSFSAVSAQGRFSNGQTAASVPVEVRLDGQGIAIREFSGHPTSPVVWSYGGLHAGVSLSKETDEVLLSSGSMPGATLFVADRGFVAALAAAAPHLKTSAERWRIAKPLVMLAVALVTAVGVARYLGFSPVNVAAALMPDSMRTALGGRVLTSLTRGLRPCNGAAGRAALDKLTERLTAAGAASTKFHVFVFDWDLVNAFAVPGEQIILTRALIETAHSVDEVAGVLAHEM